MGWTFQRTEEHRRDAEQRFDVKAASLPSWSPLAKAQQSAFRESSYSGGAHPPAPTPQVCRTWLPPAQKRGHAWQRQGLPRARPGSVASPGHVRGVECSLFPRSGGASLVAVAERDLKWLIKSIFVFMRCNSEGPCLALTLRLTTGFPQRARSPANSERCSYCSSTVRPDCALGVL